jgi:hypothetical protein
MYGVFIYFQHIVTYLHFIYKWAKSTSTLPVRSKNKIDVDIVEGKFSMQEMM